MKPRRKPVISDYLIYETAKLMLATIPVGNVLPTNKLRQYAEALGFGITESALKRCRRYMNAGSIRYIDDGGKISGWGIVLTQKDRAAIEQEIKQYELDILRYELLTSSEFTIKGTPKKYVIAYDGKIYYFDNWDDVDNFVRTLKFRKSKSKVEVINEAIASVKERLG